MSRASYRSPLAGPGIMLLSAAIFGYFGFATSWNYHSGLTGEFLLFVALLIAGFWLVGFAGRH